MTPKRDGREVSAVDAVGDAVVFWSLLGLLRDDIRVIEVVGMVPEAKGPNAGSCIVK